MANNIVIGLNVLVAKTTGTFVDAGITSLNTEIIYEVGPGLKSFKPGRAINQISGFNINKGYYIIAKQAMDLSGYLVPPLSGAVDTTAPTISTKATSSPTTISIVFSEIVTSGLTGWSFRMNGGAITASGVTGSGTNTLVFTIPTVNEGDVLDVSYNPGTGNCMDAASNELATLTNSTVTNTISFQLADISGLQVLYDATDNASLSVTGSNVNQVLDKSGNGNHAVTSGTKPLIATDFITGRQVINMDPSDSGLPLTTELVNSSYTIFLVYKILIHSGSTVYLAGATGHFNYMTTNEENSIIGIGGAGTQTFQFDESADEMAVMCIRVNSGVEQIVEYNGRQRVRTTGSTPSAPFYMGRIGSYNGGSWAGGAFAGFAYYDSFLSDTNAKKVARKLSQIHNVNPAPYYKIIGFGDSHTVGVGADAGMGWIYQVADSLGKKVVVQGRSGSLFQDITGTDATSGYNRYKRELFEYPTNDRLYILYGFNDIPNGAASLSTYTTQLGVLLADALSFGYPASRIYVGTIPRFFGDAHSALVQDYGDAVRAFCTANGLHCAEVYQAIVDNGGDTLYYTDNLHFNNAGHTVIANAFLAA